LLPKFITTNSLRVTLLRNKSITTNVTRQHQTMISFCFLPHKLKLPRSNYRINLELLIKAIGTITLVRSPGELSFIVMRIRSTSITITKLQMIRGIAYETATEIDRERKKRPFPSIEDAEIRLKQGKLPREVLQRFIWNH